MDEKPKARRRGFWLLAAPPALLAMYVLSVGPAWLMASYFDEGDPWVGYQNFYYPLAVLSESCEWFRTFMEHYGALWGAEM